MLPGRIAANHQYPARRDEFRRPKSPGRRRDHFWQKWSAHRLREYRRISSPPGRAPGTHESGHDLHSQGFAGASEIPIRPLLCAQDLVRIGPSIDSSFILDKFPGQMGDSTAKGLRRLKLNKSDRRQSPHGQQGEILRLETSIRGLSTAGRLSPDPWLLAEALP